MADWWQWSQKRENEALTFAVVGVGRFGTAVCRELISNGVAENLLVMVQMFWLQIIRKKLLMI